MTLASDAFRLTANTLRSLQFSFDFSPLDLGQIAMNDSKNIVLCNKCHSEIPRFSCPDQFLARNRSTEPVSEQEVPVISQSISNCALEIEVYEAEIDQLRQTLASLESERSLALKFKEAQCGLLSPVRKLPVEVLGEIFKFYVWEEEKNVSSIFGLRRRTGKRTFFMSAGILNAASTCTLWRAVARSIPSLWSNIIIRFDSRYEFGGCWAIQPEEILTTLLRYSATYPLTITAHLYGPTRDVDPSLPFRSHFHYHLYSFFEPLLQECSRWKSLTLSVDDAVLNDLAEKCLELDSTFPLLEDFNLVFSPSCENIYEEDWSAHLTSKTFTSAPIHRLALPEWIIRGKNLFDLSQVTSLTLDIFSMKISISSLVYQLFRASEFSVI
ncbi:hypothetical protein VKT23_010687 [Stygiomarasmius scandens]|uniref:F-box domain-containing protein n=1 Tax=Marasmiellus scandens TaxID=2682957 RepID=A0ABR1JFR5_9AGAR